MVNIFLLEHTDYSLVAVRCLSELPDARVHVFSKNKISKVRFSRFKKTFTDCSALNDSELIAKLNERASRLENTVLVPMNLKSVQFVSEHLSEFTGLSHVALVPTHECLEIAVDKWKTAQHLVQNHLHAPVTVLYREGEEFEREVRALPGPYLIKPRSGESGDGIRIFQSADELIEFFKKSEAHQFERWLVQDCIPGHDIDCSVLCRDGKVLAYTIQTALDTNRSSFTPAGRLKFLNDSTVISAAQGMMQSLHWNGIAHMDLRYDDRDGSLHIIEINPRYWATLMQSLSAGVNFPALHVEDALGKTFPVPAFKEYEYYGMAGVLKTIMRYGWSCSGLSYRLRDPISILAAGWFKLAMPKGE